MVCIYVASAVTLPARCGWWPPAGHSNGRWAVGIFKAAAALRWVKYRFSIHRWIPTHNFCCQIIWPCAFHCFLLHLQIWWSLAMCVLWPGQVDTWLWQRASLASRDRGQWASASGPCTHQWICFSSADSYQRSWFSSARKKTEQILRSVWKRNQFGQRP